MHRFPTLRWKTGVNESHHADALALATSNFDKKLMNRGLRQMVTTTIISGVTFSLRADEGPVYGTTLRVRASWCPSKGDRFRKRWTVETFFKWVKQNLSIKHFFGNSINAVKSQIWIAVCVYLVVAIARKRLNLPASPQLLLNIFEVNMFEKISLDQLVANALLHFDEHPADNQLNLF